MINAHKSANNEFQTAPRLLCWRGFPWVISTAAVALYGCYLFSTHRKLVVNDLFGYVWMALEERNKGLGRSTNSVMPAGYPILLNLVHACGVSYMNAGRALSLVAGIPLLAFVWLGASMWGQFPWAGLVAWYLTITSYGVLLSLATPLPDLIALSMAFPLITMLPKADRSVCQLFIAALFAGLACCLRYVFIQSVVPFTVALLLVFGPQSLQGRFKQAGAILGGLVAGLLPEIIFALRAGHIPFQNSSKYYLRLLTGEADFFKVGTQLRGMKSTFGYMADHLAQIVPVWALAYLRNVALFALAPAVIWWFSTKCSTGVNQEERYADTHRRMGVLLAFQAALLIPISLRQPLPYYATPILLSVASVAASLPLVRLVSGSRFLVGVLVLILVALAIVQMRIVAIKFAQYGHFAALNSAIAAEIRRLGVRDSSEVLNLVTPFDLFWPYGERSPLIYYTPGEPGWLALTNTLERERPFIFQLTKDNLARFRIVLSRSRPSGSRNELLSGFMFVKQIDGIDIYQATLPKK